MGNLIFSHENSQVGTLEVSVNPDEVRWGYNLNTQTFPTYKGEVVQILSVYIDDLMIQGEVSSVAEIERIYDYFADYMTIASQGTGAAGSASYVQTPMKMMYTKRNWTFEIQPLSAPGFAYGREVVIPTWGIVAHVVDKTGDNTLQAVKEIISAQAVNSDLPQDVTSGSFTLSGMISPHSGNPDTNPFQTYISASTQASIDQINNTTDYFQSLIPSYLKGDFSSVWSGIGSSPSFGDYGSKSQGQTQVAVSKVATSKKS